MTQDRVSDLPGDSNPGNEAQRVLEESGGMGGAQQHNGAEVGQDVNVEDPHLQEGDYGDGKGRNADETEGVAVERTCGGDGGNDNGSQ